MFKHPNRYEIRNNDKVLLPLVQIVGDFRYKWFKYRPDLIKTFFYNIYTIAGTDYYL